MTLAQQYQLFSPGYTLEGDVVAKARHLLQEFPETRDDYAELVVRFWLEFDGLDEVLPPYLHDRFIRWYCNGATSPKTIVNRAMELQRQYPALDASPEVRALRDRQAKQGPVR